MSRPRNDQEGPTAVERMEEAFWTSLAEKPFAKITVSDIVQRAHINKNAFYYHFEGLDELAAQAIDQVLLRDIAEILIGGKVAHEALLASLANDPEFQRRLKRIQLVAGTHGNHELAAVLKNLTLQAWFEMFRIDAADLNQEDVLVVRFALGGLMELIGSDERFLGDPQFFQALTNIGLMESTSTTVIAALRAAAQRKRGYTVR